MGAWDATGFGNDDALDWVWELDDATDTTAIEAALRRVADADVDDYVEAPESSMAIAAAEVVAALRSRPPASLPDEVVAFLARVPGPPTDSLVVLARHALARVRTDSELQALWDESPSAAEWHAAVADLEARLL